MPTIRPSRANKNNGNIDDTNHVVNIIRNRLASSVTKNILTLKKKHQYEDILLTHIKSFATEKSVRRLSNLPPMRVLVLDMYLHFDNAKITQHVELQNS